MLGPLLSALALARVKHAAERSVRNAAMSLAVMLLALVGGGFLIAAAFIAIAREVGPVFACLVFATLFLFAGLVTWLVKRSRRPASAPMRNAAMLGAAGSFAAARDDEGGPPRRGPGLLSRASHSKLVIVLPAIAFAAAVIAGRRSRPGDYD